MKSVGILTSHQLLWFLAKHLPRPGIRTPDLPVLSPKVFIHSVIAMVSL